MHWSNLYGYLLIYLFIYLFNLLIYYLLLLLLLLKIGNDIKADKAKLIVYFPDVDLTVYIYSFIYKFILNLLYIYIDKYYMNI